MGSSSFSKAGMLALLIVVAAIAGWEIYLRSSGIGITYDDGPPLWSHKRQQVYLPADKATVLIGSSRNKFDVDIPTWEALTGESVLQLAEVGSNPLPYLADLANDPDFKGKLLIDVSEPLFFTFSPQATSAPRKEIAYYHKRTPAQRASFAINRVLESNFTFLDKNFLSLNGLLLSHVSLPNRPGVYTMPAECPIDFGRTTFDRQNRMSARFESDSNLQNGVKSIWNFYRTLSPGKPMDGRPLDSLLAIVKSNVDRIRARGGQVVFVRSPSSGPFLQGEQMGYPRAKYWDRLLTVTGCQGIHFSDYPAIANFRCPEFSHLNHHDAVIYTSNLVGILETDKGWSFPHGSPVNTNPKK